ncbi:MAG: response regulator transcription factor [Candidatus Riflebacteria bacterium]|nr:response regulator transcription factor [Candidatus Riflebacteria bacterium]
MKHILIVDDDTELCELLQEYFTAEELSSEAVHDGLSGLNKIKNESFDLVILDIMLPEMNGLDLLKEVRKISKIPVIMLTAKGDEIDRILGLELGADDYMPKPFSPRELVARIRAVFRRLEITANKSKDNYKIELNGVILDSSTKSVTKDGQNLSLTEVEFSLLEQLMRSAGNVVERQDLALKVLGRRLTYDDRSLDVHMSNLRKKLGNSQGGNDLIKTIRGIGYLYVKPEN